MAEQVVSWRARDGKIFETEEAALVYEESQEVVEYLEAHNNLCWRDVTPSEVVDALRERYLLVDKRLQLGAQILVPAEWINALEMAGSYLRAHKDIAGTSHTLSSVEDALAMIGR